MNAIADNIERLADQLRASAPDAAVAVTFYPSGSAVLDVTRSGRLFVMAYAPSRGLGVDEVRDGEGFVVSYRHNYEAFDVAAAKLCDLAAIDPALAASCPTQGTHIKLNSFTLRTRDLERAKSFYELIGLSFKPEKHGKGPAHYSCELCELLIELYPQQASNGAIATTRLGFEVPSVDGTIQRLRQAGCDVVTEPHDSPWGRRAVVRDPDGNTVELTAKTQSNTLAGQSPAP
jgi:predicted enzyme related to lactoylglutathione lyase